VPVRDAQQAGHPAVLRRLLDDLAGQRLLGSLAVVGAAAGQVPRPAPG
jgi:hypothetical protein